MWRWLFIAVGLLAMGLAIAWTQSQQRGAQSLAGVYIMDATHADTQAYIEEARRHLHGFIVGKHEQELREGARVALPSRQSPRLETLILLDNGEAGMRPVPPYEGPYPHGRWTQRDGEVIVTLNRYGDQPLPESTTARGTWRDERLHLTVTFSGGQAQWVFERFAETADCHCDADTPETTWCWTHKRGRLRGVDTDCWSCVLHAEDDTPCIACRDHFAEAGRAMLLAGDHARALPLLARAYQLSPRDDPNLRFMLGQCVPDLNVRMPQIDKQAWGTRPPIAMASGLIVVLSTEDVVVVDALTGAVIAQSKVRSKGSPHPPSPVVPAVAISPTGTHVAIDEDTQVRLLTIGSEAEELVLKLVGATLTEGIDPVQAIRFSADGKRLVVSEMSRLSLWSISGQQVAGASGVRNAALNETGDLVAALDFGGQCVVIDERNEMAVRFRRKYGSAHWMSFAFGGDLLSVAGIEGHPLVLDLKTGDVVAGYSSGGTDEQAAFFASGHRLLQATDEGTRVYITDLEHAQKTDFAPEPQLTELASLPSQRAWPQDSSIAPDGQRFATADASGTVYVYAGDTMALMAVYQTGLGELLSVMFTPDGAHLIAVAEGGQLSVWRTAPETRNAAEVSTAVAATSPWVLRGRELVPRSDK